MSTPYLPFPGPCGQGAHDHEGMQVRGNGGSPRRPPTLLPPHTAPHSPGFYHPSKRPKVEVEEMAPYPPASIKLPPPAMQDYGCGTPPLKLKLSVTPSFLDLVALNCASTQDVVAWEATRSTPIVTKSAFDVDPATKEKRKASNFPASLLRIGSWEMRLVNDGDLVVKCYFAKRRLVWEVLQGVLKNKIEIAWKDISAIRAMSYVGKSILEVELEHPPQFFHEDEPKPRKHTRWSPAGDFTGGEATVCRRHHLEFPAGILEKHYGKLLESDDRLRDLSRAPFPRSISPYFSPCGDETPSSSRVNPDSQSAVVPHNDDHGFLCHALFQPSNQRQSSSQTFQDHAAGSTRRHPRGLVEQGQEIVIGRSSSTVVTASSHNQFLVTHGGKHQLMISPLTSTGRRRTPADVVHGSYSSSPDNWYASCVDAARVGVPAARQEQNRRSGTPCPPAGDMCRGQILEMVKEHLLGDQEILAHDVDEQEFLARVRSMGSLIQPDYEGKFDDDTS